MGARSLSRNRGERAGSSDGGDREGGRQMSSKDRAERYMSPSRATGARSVSSHRQGSSDGSGLPEPIVEEDDGDRGRSGRR